MQSSSADKKINSIANLANDNNNGTKKMQKINQIGL